MTTKINTKEFKKILEPDKEMLKEKFSDSDIAFYKSFKNAYNFNVKEFKYNGKKMNIEHQGVVVSEYKGGLFRFNYFYKNRVDYNKANPNVYSGGGSDVKDNVVKIQLKDDKLSISHKPSIITQFRNHVMIVHTEKAEKSRLVKQNIEITLKEDDIEIIKDILNKKTPTIPRSKHKDITENTKPFKKMAKKAVAIMKGMGELIRGVYKKQKTYADSVKVAYILKINDIAIINDKKEPKPFENKYLQLVVFKNNHIGIAFSPKIERLGGNTKKGHFRKSMINIFDDKNIDITLKDNILIFKSGDYKSKSKFNITLASKGDELVEIDNMIRESNGKSGKKTTKKAKKPTKKAKKTTKKAKKTTKKVTGKGKKAANTVSRKINKADNKADNKSTKKVR